MLFMYLKMMVDKDRRTGVGEQFRDVCCQLLLFVLYASVLVTIL